MNLKLYAALSGNIFVITLLLFGHVGYSQQTPAETVIQGKVTDAQTHEALTGASVGIKGSSKVVVTDKSGNYSISAGPNATLVFSYTGNKTTEVAVHNQTTIKAELAKLTVNCRMWWLPH